MSTSPAAEEEEEPEDSRSDPDAPEDVNPEPSTTSPLPVSEGAERRTTEPLELDIVDPL